MKLLQCLLTSAWIISLPISAQALDVGEDDFKWASELADAGFQPFPTSSAGNASFGMMKDQAMYLCFLADNSENQATRRDQLIANMQDSEASSRTVPNIPVACVLIQ